MVSRRMIGCSRLARSDYAVPLKFGRPGSGRDWRSSLVSGRSHLRVGARHGAAFYLCWGGREMAVLRYALLLRTGAHVNSALSSVIADVIIVDDRDIVDDGPIDVNIPNYGFIHMGNCSVVVEVVMVPSAAIETVPEVAKAVVDAPVPSDLSRPEAFVEKERTVFPSPPGRSPEQAGLWSGNPGAWNPVIILYVRIPSPVSWHPNPAVLRAYRLVVDGKCRWCKGNANFDLAERWPIKRQRKQG